MSVAVDVAGLSVAFRTARGVVPAVRDVSFHLDGRRIGIVGESGSGKSTVARALVGLLPSNARVEATRMHFGDVDLLRLPPTQWPLCKLWVYQQ